MVLLKFNILDTTGEYYIHNEKLRDRILAYPDQIKKNYYIRIFALNFLRYSNSDENKYWLYCNSTNIKLLPQNYGVNELIGSFLIGQSHVGFVVGYIVMICIRIIEIISVLILMTVFNLKMIIRFFKIKKV